MYFKLSGAVGLRKGYKYNHLSNPKRKVEKVAYCDVCGKEMESKGNKKRHSSCYKEGYEESGNKQVGQNIQLENTL